MNRREFIQTVLGSTITVFTVSTLGLGAAQQEALWDEANVELKDLLLWAPYEAFLPEQHNPVLDNPSDGTGTGTLKASQIEAGEAVTFKYWHGHGGKNHTFTVTAEHMKALKAGSMVKINIPTTVVDDHYHFTIIDPKKPA